jgi:hypothetical protein
VRRGIIVFVLLLVLVSHASTDELLQGRFWWELEPYYPTEDEYPLSEETAIRRLLEEARYTFSGMLYGFEFVYTPPDKAREVEEVFRLEPIAEIPWGDPRLQVRQSWVREKRLYATLTYRVAPFQEARLQGWGSNAIPTAGGQARAELYLGFPQRTVAIEKAVKQAIREHLRERYFNKPREARGQVLLREVPLMGIVEGSYRASVDVKVQIDQVEPYLAY